MNKVTKQQLRDFMYGLDEILSNSECSRSYEEMTDDVGQLLQSFWVEVFGQRDEDMEEGVIDG